MTRGKTPEWADTEWAQWIKARLDQLGWQKKDLIAALLLEDGGERIRQSGAEGVVNRVTKRGSTPDAANAALIIRVLGPRPTSLPEGLEERVAILEAGLARLGNDLGDLASLPERVLALEHQAQPKTGRGGRR